MALEWVCMLQIISSHLWPIVGLLRASSLPIGQKASATQRYLGLVGQPGRSPSGGQSALCTANALSSISLLALGWGIAVNKTDPCSSMVSLLVFARTTKHRHLIQMKFTLRS